MCASSMMYLPSLYFWLVSKACSCNREDDGDQIRIHGNCLRNESLILTYFHPSGVLQHSQYISATAWRPVKRIRSSACPQDTLTLFFFFKQTKIQIIFFFILGKKYGVEYNTYTELNR